MADIQHQIAAGAQARAVTGNPRSPRGGRGVGDRHGCPGDCGRTVPRHRLACPGCWPLLPGPLRLRVTTAYTAHRRSPHDVGLAAEHRQALTAALAWYRTQHRPPRKEPST